jgi:hypothetical protein
MNNDQLGEEKNDKLEEPLEAKETKFPLKKRLIWQHLAQKKISKSLKSKIKSVKLKD